MGSVDTPFGIIYTNPDNSSDVIIRLNEFDHTGNAITGQAVKLPEEVAKIINYDDFWDSLSKDPVLQERFASTMNSLVNTRAGEALRAIFGTRNLSEEDWKKLGIDGEDLTKLLYELKKSSKTIYKSLNQRHLDYLRDLYVPKNAEGGVIGKHAASEGKTEKLTVDYVADPTKSHDVFDSGNLTTADKWLLGSVVGDLAALAMSAAGVPGVPAALGLAGTVAGFYSDIARDGMDWGDWGNLAVGLGTDALAFFPEAGWSKLAPLVNRVRKAGHLIRPLLLGAGLSQGIEPLDKIISGEEVTIDDVRKLATAVTAAYGGIQNARVIRNTNYKGSSKVTPKTREALRRERLQKAVDEHPSIKEFEGKTVNWIDEKTGKIKDTPEALEEAAKQLTDKGWYKELSSFKSKTAIKASEASAAVQNRWNGKYNPLSRDYFGRMSNRVMKEGYTPSDGVFRDIKPMHERMRYYGVEGVPGGTPQHKKGGVIKKANGGMELTFPSDKLLEMGNSIISDINNRHYNDSLKEAVSAAKFNIEQNNKNVGKYQ